MNVKSIALSFIIISIIFFLIITIRNNKLIEPQTNNIKDVSANSIAADSIKSKVYSDENIQFNIIKFNNYSIVAEITSCANTDDICSIKCISGTVDNKILKSGESVNYNCKLQINSSEKIIDRIFIDIYDNKNNIVESHQKLVIYDVLRNSISIVPPECYEIDGILEYDTDSILLL